jgi:hypothetical protein
MTGVGSFLNIFKYRSMSDCTSPGKSSTKDFVASFNTAAGLSLSSAASKPGP